MVTARSDKVDVFMILIDTLGKGVPAVVTAESKNVHVFIGVAHAIPDVSRKTGISVEELTRRFNEAEAKGIVCTFEMKLPIPNWKEVSDEQFDRRERRDTSSQNGPH